MVAGDLPLLIRLAVVRTNISSTCVALLEFRCTGLVVSFLIEVKLKYLTQIDLNLGM